MLFSMTFQAWKMVLLNSTTFHDQGTPCQLHSADNDTVIWMTQTQHDEEVVISNYNQNGYLFLAKVNSKGQLKSTKH